MSTNKHRRENKLVRVLIFVGAVLLALTLTVVFPLLNQDANYIARLPAACYGGVANWSSEAAVDRWLRNNTKYLPTKNVPPQIDIVQGHDVIELAGMPRGQVASVLRATVPRQDVVSKFKEDYVRVYFFFDEQGRLIGNYLDLWLHHLPGCILLK